MTAPDTKNPQPTPVSVLGLGPMGRALASAFLTAGHPVTVWNRTPGKADGLADRGASVAHSAEEAIRAGQVVVACLIDYAAVRAVLGPRCEALAGRRLVNLTSGEPADARQMAAWASARGIGYLDGAILTPTPAVGTASAAVLCSGDPEVHRAVQATLTAIGGTSTYLGTDPGTASAYDVALLDIFATSVNGITHAFALASAEGIPPERFAALATGIGGLLPEMITRFAQQIQADEYPGDRSTIASAASGITHIINASAAHGIDVGMLTAAKRTLDHALAEGHGGEGLARLATTLRKPGR